MSSQGNESPALVRAVSRWQIVGLSINDVIGSGIYLLPAATAALLGPMSLWAVMLAGLAVALLVLCYAQAASYFDTPGGSYLYTREAFGPFTGFQIGWMIWLTRISSAAALSNGLADAVARFWPAAGSNGWERLLVVVGSLGLLTAINVIGVKSAARTGVALVIGKLVPLLLFVAIGLFYVDWSWAFAGSTPDLRDLGNLGEAALLLLFAYAGFENIPAAAGEYRNPRRDVPFALITMIVTVTLIYAAVQVVAQGTLPNLAASPTPLADAASRFGGEALALILTVGATISILGTTSNTVMLGPRFCLRWRRMATARPSLHASTRASTPCGSRAHARRAVAGAGFVGLVYAAGTAVDGHAAICLYRHGGGGDRAGTPLSRAHRCLAPARWPAHSHRRPAVVAWPVGERQLAEPGRRRAGLAGGLRVLPVPAQAGLSASRRARVALTHD